MASPTEPLGADLDRLRGLEGRKWTRYEPDVLPAWVADQDFAPAPVAVEAMQRVIDRGDFGYNMAARDQLVGAFSDWQDNAHGWRPDPSEVHLFNDVLHALHLTIWLHTQPGDGIVIFTPIYPPFIKAIQESGRRIVECPLDADGWRLDEDVLAGCIDASTRVLLWCNPHNPTGRVFTDDELAMLERVVVDRDLIVISDEVWGDLVHPGSVHRPAALIGHGQSEGLASRTVTLSSASKSFSLAGLRCAVAHFGPPEIRRSFEQLPSHLTGAVNTLGAEATLACWRHGGPWLNEVRAHLTAQRDHLDVRLRADLPLVRWQIPEATYLAWLDVSSTGLTAEMLLEKGRVACSDGDDFGSLGAGHIRLNTATSRSILDAIVDRIIATSTVGDATHTPSEC